MFGPSPMRVRASPRHPLDQRGSGLRAPRPVLGGPSAADLDAVRGHFGLAKTGPRALLRPTLALRYALDHPDRVSALAYVSGWRSQRSSPEPADFLAAAEPMVTPGPAGGWTSSARAPAADTDCFI